MSNLGPVDAVRAASLALAATYLAYSCAESGGPEVAAGALSCPDAGHQEATGAGGSFPSCSPSPGARVPHGCGVFVDGDRGSDQAPGTQEEPLRTIGAGLALAEGAAVYACDSHLAYVETLEVSGVAADVHGGVSCAWLWDEEALLDLHGRAVLGPSARLALDGVVVHLPGALAPFELGEGAELQLGRVTVAR